MSTYDAETMHYYYYYELLICFTMMLVAMKMNGQCNIVVPAPVGGGAA